MHQRLESLLDDWQALDLPFVQRPRIARQLQGGKTNQSFLLEADGERWVLRFNAPISTALGIDREREALIHRAAAAAGLAPDLIRWDRQRGIAVTRFVEGEIVAPGALSTAQLHDVLTVWSDLRTLKIDVAPTRYRDILLSLGEPEQQREPIDATLAQAIARLEKAGPNSLCHHDLVPTNVLFTSRGVVLLDWEYAGLGAPVLDLATLVVDWKLPLKQICAMSNTEPDLLDAAVVVYRQLCARWVARQHTLSAMADARTEL